MSISQFKKKVVSLLEGDDIDGALAELSALPQKKLLKPLFSSLCSCDDVVKWHAITAMGQVVSAIAEQDFENARIVMRRFMWMLNDESGGIGWGVPEAMGEVTASHPKLAMEYAHILVSFMREDGFYLELEVLQRGLMWGLARLAQAHPELLLKNKADFYLQPYLESSDYRVMGLAALALRTLIPGYESPSLAALEKDERTITIYLNREFSNYKIAELATI